ncbi:UDP-2,4-diacetamido-2,4,6-trideoxy-beta-L-altropyranose hydrolase [Shewanella sp. MF08487]|uniref:UDP-2,4-diacetamido-2,4, 6-trideoxy-beta-L-altropyranose hydrolase n=1 Tax=Shewanella sp. MF08487 TaxID=3434873 RepID=UPI003D7947C7
MNIVIRADAAVQIGSGHIMRCLVLAKELTNQGYSVSFACRRQPGDLIGLIQRRGLSVVELASPVINEVNLTPNVAVESNAEADYAASWLGVSWQQDADSLLAQIKDVDLLIVDHYGINIEWEQYVRNVLDCKLFIIDDLLRLHAADLLLDQTPMREDSAYVLQSTIKRVLAGSDYALLADNFAPIRETIMHRHVTTVQPRVLITMGAMDLPNATGKVLEAFLQLPADDRPQITVLLGQHAPHYQVVKKYIKVLGNKAKHFDYVENMAEIMVQHDLAIGAAGTTALERACLGLPSILIPLADNQRAICNNLVAANAAIYLELDEITTKLTVQYAFLTANLTEFRARNLVLCDGLGVKRVLVELNGLLSYLPSTLGLRKATHDDIEQVYNWQIQPQTRQYSPNPQSPSWLEHQVWMQNQLSNAEHFFYLIIDNVSNLNLGVVRLNRIAQCEYVISIFIDPSYYGQKIATRALAIIDIIHRDVTIHARVMQDNSASQQLFTSANYQQVTSEIFIRAPIK